MEQETQKRAASSETTTPSLEIAVQTPIPLIAKVRPGLAEASAALVRRLPSDYRGKTVSDVLGYVVSSEISPEEAGVARSLKDELGAAGSLIVINGQDAKLTDRVEKYAMEKTRDVGGRSIAYQELEIEVSAVQQGGYSGFRR